MTENDDDDGSKLSHGGSKRFSRWKLKLLISPDLLLQYEPSTASRQLKARRILRVSLTGKALVVEEFSAKEEDFQWWSKKTEAFSAGVIQESEMMLESSAEQATEITTASIWNSCQLRRMRNEEFKTWSLCCSRCVPSRSKWLQI